MAKWAAVHPGLSHSCLNQLLAILIQHGHELPKDCRTLMSTPKKVDTVAKCGGQFIYVGLQKGILKSVSQSRTFQENKDTIELLINVDGVPLFKSTNTQFWPILCKFHTFEPFVVALFCGKTKPDPLEDFITEFIEELQHLEENGISFDNKTYTIKIKSFVCDAPARSFLKCIKGHNSYDGCERCITHGSWNGRVVFDEIDR